MNKSVATALAVLGGAWTGLCGVLLVGLLASLGTGSTTVSEISGSPSATPFIGLAIALLVGIAIFWVGMKGLSNRPQH